jgi:hypothetical protein
MKILFILGSCEKGRDGVADYTIKLATELSKRNFVIRILSVNDKFLGKDASRKETIAFKVEVLRLSASSSWQMRHLVAQGYVCDFNPDWLSLQYVPFAFQKKGLPIRICQLLHSLRKKRNLHIMFHELWIDKTFAASARHRALGTIQKQLISLSVRLLRPNLICTSNYYYGEMLESIHLKNTIQPLHSNIEVNSPREINTNWLDKHINFNTNGYYVVGFLVTYIYQPSMQTCSNQD